MKGYARIRKILCGVLLSGCMCMSGCGEKGEESLAGSGAASGGTEISEEQAADADGSVSVKELQSSEETIFQEKEGTLLGVQFYQGEAIRLRKVETAGHTDGDGQTDPASGYVSDIYLDRADGTSELLFGDLPDVDMEDWYLTRDGSVYCIAQDYSNNTSSVMKRDGQGNVLYEVQLDMRASDICQLNGGEVILLLDDGGGLNSRLRLAELNQDTGAARELSQIQMNNGDSYIGTGAEGLLVLNQTEGIREVNLQDGSSTDILGFANTSYQFSVAKSGLVNDLRILEDGSAEFLCVMGIQSTLERLGWGRLDRIPVVMRGFHFNNSWIKSAVAAFNQKNDTYYISLEEAGDDWGDFATQTSVQIASGGGPDLLYGEVLSDYIQGMLDKGGFEELTPYMEQSGIKEEDYFPLAFSSWRRDDKIYGINVSVFTYRYIMDAAVLGGRDARPDIETLVNALYDYEDKAMYMRYHGSGDILNQFLQGSENLWGMIDWEQNSCDFSGELFAKMMEVAKRYAYDENQDYPILASRSNCDYLFGFEAPAVLEETGMEEMGVLFDDGCYPAVNSTYQILSINANSGKKQGAWEFIAYLLGEEGQQCLVDNHEVPVSRKAFQKKMEDDLEMIGTDRPIRIGSSYYVQGKYVDEYREIYGSDIDEEWKEAFTRAAEEARPLPVRTKPVLAVICEEAEDYFDGTKSLEEVIQVMENRVQLYMNENALR